MAGAGARFDRSADVGGGSFSLRCDDAIAGVPIRDLGPPAYRANRASRRLAHARARTPEVGRVRDAPVLDASLRQC